MDDDEEKTFRRKKFAKNKRARSQEKRRALRKRGLRYFPKTKNVDTPVSDTPEKPVHKEQEPGLEPDRKSVV